MIVVAVSVGVVVSLIVLRDAAHLLVFKDRSHLLRPLVTLLGQQTVAFFGDGELDHVHIAVQHAVDGQFWFAGEQRSLFVRLCLLLELVLAQTLDLPSLHFGLTVLADEGVALLL